MIFHRFFQVISIVVCFDSLIGALSGTCSRISSMAPSRLSLATSVSCNDCTIKSPLSLYPFYEKWDGRPSDILRIYDDLSMDCTLNCCPEALTHCCTLRYLFSNQLNGTIPPQLANLTKLQQLYAQNRIPLLRNSLISNVLLY